MKFSIKVAGFFGYLGIYLWAFLQSYILSLFCTPFIICVVFSVLSLCHIPFTWIMTHFQIVYTAGSLPLALVLFVIILVNYYKKYSKHALQKTEKQEEK